MNQLFCLSLAMVLASSVSILAQQKDPPKNFTNSIGMKFVWIPSGSFMMGSPKVEEKRFDNETQHKVTLTKGFYMGVYTVTQKEWQAVMGNNPSRFEGEKNLPVEQVSWDDCQEFVKKLREKDQRPYRLPSEAEWEYSCRAGTKTPFSFGETISTDQANYNGDYVYANGKKGVKRDKTTSVGSFSANAWGLHDMHGNVWEWCQDWYGDYPQKDVVDPTGPEKGHSRVLRGGSWYYFPVFCRSAFRLWDEPGLRGFNFGCRLCFCLDLPVIEKPQPQPKDTPKPPVKIENPQAQEKDPPKNFTNSIGMKFVWISPGTFMMGSPKEEKRRLDDETQHKVTLTKGFYMGVYTVTQEEWQAVMGNNPSYFKGEKNLPVEQVSWDDCQEFVKKLREKDQKPYRLPSEAEWEYSCRAGTRTPFHFGETISTDQANYNGRFAYGDGKKGVKRDKTTSVGSFSANAWGLHDMDGNVEQWCQDWYGDYPQKDVVDPTGPEMGHSRVLRGGSWSSPPAYCRSANRLRHGPGIRTTYFGLRVCFCLDLPVIEKPQPYPKDTPKPPVKIENPQVQEKDPTKPPFTNSIGMKFVWIPPGSFLMGSPKEEKLRIDNETQHKVTLTKGFYMGVYTVTQEEWQAVMGNNPSFFKGEKNLPVEQVSWDDCQEFVKKLREKDKKLYRLPSEAEWEYACRAGTKTPFHFGETISTDQANYNGRFAYGDGKKGVFREKTTPVGSFPANAWGLHDMHGNVWQWCQDWYGGYPQKDVVDPTGPEKGHPRVLRGGSWYILPEDCRSAFRVRLVPGLRDFNVGFRVCFCLD